MDKKEILIVVDMQNDFITGELGSNQAQDVVPRVCDKIKNTKVDKIFYTIDTHEQPFYSSTVEGQKIPDHCMLFDDGWYVHPDVACALRDVVVDIEEIEKDTFGSVDELPETITEFCVSNKCSMNNLTINIIGLCTDICVISNALILRSVFPKARIVVDADCCAGSTPARHQWALQIMKANCIDIINW